MSSRESCSNGVFEFRHALGGVLAVGGELAAHGDTDQMLRRAVELAREYIGLERVGLYLRDPNSDRVILRGTWGTGAQGETIDEHALYHECDAAACDLYTGLQRKGQLWRYHDRVPRFAELSGRTIALGHSWLIATPLLAGSELVGVMYNDSVLSHAPVDELKQTQAAVFCTLLATLFLPRRGLFSWSEPGSRRPSPVVRRVVHALEQNPRCSGERLARELSVSASYLARSFKAEMGVSLVEYRNRRMMERFFHAIDRSRGNLLSAALAAGFGSYTQFHRVYRKMYGMSPREHLKPRLSEAAVRAAPSHFRNVSQIRRIR
jgi:AraC-like DNA-binding protein